MRAKMNLENAVQPRMDTDGHSAADAATIPSPPSDGGEGRGEEERFGKDQPPLSDAPPHEPRSAGVPPAGWPGVSPGDRIGGETPPALAAGDGRATVVPVQRFKARNSLWENSHPGPLPARSSRGEGEKRVAKFLSKMRDSSSLYYGYQALAGGKRLTRRVNEARNPKSAFIRVNPWLMFLCSVPTAGFRMEDGGLRGSPVVLECADVSAFESARHVAPGRKRRRAAAVQDAKCANMALLIEPTHQLPCAADGRGSLRLPVVGFGLEKEAFVAGFDDSIKKVPFFDEKSPKSPLEVPKSVTNLIKSEPDLTFSVTDLIKSETDLTFSVTDLTKSETDLTFSMTDLIKSEADLTRSTTDISDKMAQNARARSLKVSTFCRRTELVKAKRENGNVAGRVTPCAPPLVFAAGRGLPALPGMEDVFHPGGVRICRRRGDESFEVSTPYVVPYNQIR